MKILDTHYTEKKGLIYLLDLNIDGIYYNMYELSKFVEQGSIQGLTFINVLYTGEEIIPMVVFNDIPLSSYVLKTKNIKAIKLELKPNVSEFIQTKLVNFAYDNDKLPLYHYNDIFSRDNDRVKLSDFSEVRISLQKLTNFKDVSLSDVTNTSTQTINVLTFGDTQPPRGSSGIQTSVYDKELVESNTDSYTANYSEQYSTAGEQLIKDKKDKEIISPQEKLNQMILDRSSNLEHKYTEVENKTFSRELLPILRRLSVIEDDEEGNTFIDRLTDTMISLGLPLKFKIIINRSADPNSSKLEAITNFLINYMVNLKWYSLDLTNNIKQINNYQLEMLSSKERIGLIKRLDTVIRACTEVELSDMNDLLGVVDFLIRVRIIPDTFRNTLSSYSSVMDIWNILLKYIETSYENNTQ